MLCGERLLFLVGPLGFEPRTKGLCLPLRLSPLPLVSGMRGLDHAFAVMCRGRRGTW